MGGFCLTSGWWARGSAAGTARSAGEGRGPKGGQSLEVPVGNAENHSMSDVLIWIKFYNDIYIYVCMYVCVCVCGWSMCELFIWFCVNYSELVLSRKAWGAKELVRVSQPHDSLVSTCINHFNTNIFFSRSHSTKLCLGYFCPNSSCKMGVHEPNQLWIQLTGSMVFLWIPS